MVAAAVGFTLSGAQRDRTAAHPCLWAESHCNKGDYYNWLTHTNQWMFAVLARMGSPAELRAMAPMVRNLATLTRTDIGFLDGFRLTADTLKLRDMAVNLKGIAEQLGQPVQVGEVTKDLGRPIIELPIPDELAEELGFDWNFEKFVKDLVGGATDILRAKWFQQNAPWMLGIGVALFFLLSDTGRK